MAANKKTNEVTELSFEQAIKELTAIVAKIEKGEIPLQDSIQQYEKGMLLIARCREILKQAESRIEKISEQENSSQDNPDELFA